MWPETETETLIAEFEEDTDASLKSAADKCRNDDMDIDWDKKRAELDNIYQRTFAGRDPERIRLGIEAYKRDLPQLIRDQKESYVVAYDGDACIGIEKTQEKLMAELKKNGLGLSKQPSLFIKVVSNLEDGRESMSSRSQR